jgi:hypothetical protein
VGEAIEETGGPEEAEESAPAEKAT